MAEVYYLKIGPVDYKAGCVPVMADVPFDSSKKENGNHLPSILFSN